MHTTGSTNTSFRRRRRRHPAKRARRQLIIVGLSSLFSLAAVFVTAGSIWNASARHAVIASSNPGLPAGHLDDVAEPASSSRPNYRYSVIPGGVQSREELTLAIGRDRAVAEHYRTVSLDRVRVERFEADRRAYVSYRIGDQIYWTRHQVTIPAGEPILTDGVTQIRARCGNGIAFEPQLPTLDREPDVTEFDALGPPGLLSSPGEVERRGRYRQALMLPVDALLASADALSEEPRLSGLDWPGPDGVVPLLPGMSILEPRQLFLSDALQPELTGSDLLGPGLLPGIVPGPLVPGVTFANPPGTVDLSPASELNPAPIPEPSTMVLLGSGLAGACWRRFRSRRG